MVVAARQRPAATQRFGVSRKNRLPTMAEKIRLTSMGTKKGIIGVTQHLE